MTEDEAFRIASLAPNVDSGCPSCVKDHLDDLQREFPEFNWNALADKAREGGRHG